MKKMTRMTRKKRNLERSKRKKQLEILNKILPMIKSTFKKRKELEKLKVEIKEIENKIQLLENENEVKLLKAKMLEKSKEQKCVERVILAEETFYEKESKRIKGIKLKQEEAKDSLLLLYFMWVSKMKKEDLFESYFETTRLLSRSNGSLETKLISKELNRFPYDKDFGEIFVA